MEPASGSEMIINAHSVYVYILIIIWHMSQVGKENEMNTDFKIYLMRYTN